MELKIEGPAGTLAVDDGGRGEPAFVFVHGNGGARTVWAGQLAHLRPRHRALALDLRGFGLSAPPLDGDYSIAALAADLDSVVATLGLAPAVVVGHSLGATVAAAWAGREPDRVAALVLVDPPSDLSRLPLARRHAWLAELAPGVYETGAERVFARMLAGARPRTREAVLVTLRATRPEAVRGALAALLEHDPLPSLVAYRGPKLAVVTANNDAPTSLHRLVPAIERKIVGSTSHWLMLDDPQSLNATLDRLGEGLAR